MTSMVTDEQARALIMAHAQPLAAERLPLLMALGRSLAAPAETPVLLERGRVVDAGVVGLLAAVGKTHVAVHAPPRVVVLTSGDELAEPGRRLPRGMVYNSNAHALMAFVLEAGGIPARLPIIRDDPVKARRALTEALAYDVVLATGGIGNGPFDFMGEAIAASASVHFRGITTLPGSPFTFATTPTCAIFGLPDNPAAALMRAELYVRPFLRALLGRPDLERPRVWAVATEPFDHQIGREAYVEAVVRGCGDHYEVRVAASRDDGALAPLADANALAIVPADARGFAVGDHVEAILLDPPQLCRMACHAATESFSLPRLAALR